MNIGKIINSMKKNGYLILLKKCRISLRVKIIYLFMQELIFLKIWKIKKLNIYYGLEMIGIKKMIQEKSYITVILHKKILVLEIIV